MTREFAALCLHSGRRARPLLVGMCLVLGGFQILLAAVAAWLQSQSGFGQLAGLVPPGFRQLMGTSLTGVLSVSGVVALGYFHTAVEAALVVLVLSVAGELAEEVGTGFVDLLLARPMHRALVVGRTVVWLIVAPSFAVAAMAAGTLAGQRLVMPAGAPRVSNALVGALAGNLWALLLCWGGVGAAAAAFCRRRGSVLGGVGLAALAALLVDYVARAWSPMGAIAWLSPFHYFSPVELVMGAQLRGRDMVVLLGVFGVGTVTAFAVYLRRDL